MNNNYIDQIIDKLAQLYNHVVVQRDQQIVAIYTEYENKVNTHNQRLTQTIHILSETFGIECVINAVETKPWHVKYYQLSNHPHNLADNIMHLFAQKVPDITSTLNYWTNELNTLQQKIDQLDKHIGIFEIPEQDNDFIASIHQFLLPEAKEEYRWFNALHHIYEKDNSASYDISTSDQQLYIPHPDLIHWCIEQEITKSSGGALLTWWHTFICNNIPVNHHHTAILYNSLSSLSVTLLNSPFNIANSRDNLAYMNIVYYIALFPFQVR
jgi:hypothetical protein